MIAYTAGSRRVKLNDLGFVGRGRSRHRPRDATFLYGGPYPFFQTGDVKAADLYLTDYSQTYSDAGLAQSKLWKPGTLCITIAANIAETAILGIEGCFPDSIVGFVADPAKADVRFVKYYFDTLKLQMQSVSRGTTQDNLSLDKLLSFDFNVPPVVVQQQIASVLSAYDEGIENARQRVRTLEAIAREVYLEWFVRGAIPAGRSYSAEPGVLGEVCRLVREPYSDKTHSELPLLDLARIPQRSITATEFGSPNELTTSRIVFARGDTLFGAIRCYLHKVVMAQASGVTNTSVLVLRPRSMHYRAFVALSASESSAIRWADTHSSGTKMPVINWDVLKQLEILAPNEPLAARFESTVGPMLDQLGLLGERIRLLRRTRDILLPRLLSGQFQLAD